MSRAAWINELVEYGYEPGLLDGLNNNELAELIQEEYVENTWSPEARAAAVKARHKKTGLNKKGRDRLAAATKRNRSGYQTPPDKRTRRLIKQDHMEWKQGALSMKSLRLK